MLRFDSIKLYINIKIIDLLNIYVYIYILYIQFLKKYI